MTEIIFEEWKNKIRISVIGHNSDKRICAAISMLVAALEGVLMNDFKDEYKYLDNGDGACEIVVPNKAKKYLKMFIIGLKRLEKSYPDNVLIKGIK